MAGVLTRRTRAAAFRTNHRGHPGSGKMPALAVGTNNSSGRSRGPGPDLHGAIAQDPRNRYASARSLADDLDQWLLQHRGGKLRLSFSVTTIILGLAAALLMVIGIRTALAPWSMARERLPSLAMTRAPSQPRVRPARSASPAFGCCFQLFSSSATPVRALPSRHVPGHQVHEPIEQGGPEGTLTRHVNWGFSPALIASPPPASPDRRQTTHD